MRKTATMRQNTQHCRNDQRKETPQDKNLSAKTSSRLAKPWLDCRDLEIAIFHFNWTNGSRFPTNKAGWKYQTFKNLEKEDRLHQHSILILLQFNLLSLVSLNSYLQDLSCYYIKGINAFDNESLNET